MGRWTNAVKALLTPDNYQQGSNDTFYTFFEGLKTGKKELRKSFSEGFDSNTYVYSIINKLATAASTIYVDPKIKNKQGEWELLESGDFYNFAKRPNPNQNLQQLLFEAYVYYQVTGNLVYYGVKVGKLVKEVSLLSPLKMNPDVDFTINGAYAKKWDYHVGGKTYTIKPEEIKHVKMFNSDVESVFGMSPLQAAYKTLVASNEIILADASLIKNRGAIGMLTNKGERPLTQPEREATDNALKSQIGGGSNFGAIKTTSGNFDFLSFAMSPTDLKILESGTMKKNDLCGVYGIDPKLMGSSDGGSYNNVKELKKEMYNNAVLPPLEVIIDSFSDFVIPEWNKRDNAEYKLEIRYDAIDALQEDSNTKIETQKTKSETINAILTGIGTQWSEESAVLQLVEVLEIPEKEALILVSNKPKQVINEPKI